MSCVHSHFLRNLMVSSTKTTTISASPSSTVIPTLYSSTWKSSTRPVKFPSRTWYALSSRRYPVRHAHILKVLVVRSHRDSLTCRRALRSVSTTARQDSHHGLFGRRRSGRSVPTSPGMCANCPAGRRSTAGRITIRTNPPRQRPCCSGLPPQWRTRQSHATFPRERE